MNIVSILLLVSVVWAQTEKTPAVPDPKVQEQAFAKRPAPVESGYVLGPGDQITVRVVNLEEINDKPIPVELNGEVRLPMVGRVRVSGLTVAEVETER